MDLNQIEDKAQFRRYAEAALSGCIVNSRDVSCGDLARVAFDQAIAMMLAEGQAFEAYQLQALEAIATEERARHAEGS
jgi:hypothetical protein